MSAEVHTPKFAVPPSRQHVFDEQVSVPANPLLGRHQQSERTCKMCAAVKVTVHAPEGSYRLWRRAGSTEQLAIQPRCELQINEEAFLKP